MKKLRYIFLSVMVALVAASCQKDLLETPKEEFEVPEGYVKVELNPYSDFENLSFSTRSQVRTGEPMIATSREMAISNAFICVFEFSSNPSEDKLLQYESVIRDFDASGKAHYYAVLKQVDAPVIIHGLSNIDDSTVGEITAKLSDEYLLTRAEFYDLEIPYSADSNSPLFKNASGVGAALLPKYTEAITLSKLTPETIQGISAQTRFSYTRVDVVVPSVAGSEYPKILGLSASNVPNLPAERASETLKSHEVTPLTNLPAYGETLESRQWPDGVTTANEATKYVQGLYMYYNNRKDADGNPQRTITEDQAIELIIRAQRDVNSPESGSFYKILLRYKNEGAIEYSYDTFAAARYLVNVHALNSAGYATWEAAAAAPPANVLYDITIDGTSTSFVTNGQYYIGVDKVEYSALAEYSRESNMMYANPTIITETDLENFDVISEGIYEFDFTFTVDAARDAEGNPLFSTSNLSLDFVLPAGLELLNASGYETQDTWKTGFGRKKFRVRTTSKHINGDFVIKVGELTQSSKVEIGSGIVTDYTDEAFVNELTGLSAGYGGVSGLRVANSYIAAPHDTYDAVIYLPVAKRINEFWSDADYTGTSRTTAYTDLLSTNWLAIDDYSVEFSWYDGTLIEGLSVEKAYSPARENAIKIILPPKFEHKNIVVNVKHGETIIWSWHLWVTDYNPYFVTLKASSNSLPNYPSRFSLNQVQAVVGENAEIHSYYGDIWDNGIYEDKFIMDRNLGSTGASFAENLDYGNGILYYQFGRKDPLPAGQAKWSNGASWLPPPTYRTYSFVEITNSPQVLISTGGNWTNVNMPASYTWFDKNVAIDNTSLKNKSIFDPSPLGWKVPQIEAWVNFNTSNFLFTPEQGSTYMDFDGNVVAIYPASGGRSSGADGGLVGNKTNGYYRSANARDVDFNTSFTFVFYGGGLTNPNVNNISSPISLRPIQE